MDTKYLNALGNKEDFDFKNLIMQHSDNPNMLKAHEKNVGMVGKKR